MTHPLTGFTLKLNRAEKHRQDIRQAREELADTNFYDTTTELDYRGRPVGRFRNVRQPELLANTVPLLIGDCIHNYRSALDHLAYVLATAHTAPRPLPESYARTSAFPIFNSRVKYRRRGSPGAAHKMRGMSRFARGAIERVQPYHRRKNPRRRILWMLEELSNIDKHRLIHLTAAQAAGVGGYISGLGSATQVGIEPIPGPIEEGAKFQRVHGDFTMPSEVQMDPKFTLDIVFDQRTEARSVRGQSVLDVLTAIPEVIAVEVLPELDRELHRLFPRTQLGITIDQAPAP